MHPKTIHTQVSCCEDYVLIPFAADINLTQEVVDQILAARKSLAELKAQGVRVDYIRLSDCGVAVWQDEDGQDVESNEDEDRYREEGIDVHEGYFQVFGYLNFAGTQFQCEAIYDHHFSQRKVA